MLHLTTAVFLLTCSVQAQDVSSSIHSDILSEQILSGPSSDVHIQPSDSLNLPSQPSDFLTQPSDLPKSILPEADIQPILVQHQDQSETFEAVPEANIQSIFVHPEDQSNSIDLIPEADIQPTFVHPEDQSKSSEMVPDSRKMLSSVPFPSLVLVPSREVSIPQPEPVSVTEVSEVKVVVPRPSITVPDWTSQGRVIDIPHQHLQIPQGAVETQDVIYNIPQPVIYIPRPIFQRKPVLYQVPQPLVHIDSDHALYFVRPHQQELIPNQVFSNIPKTATIRKTSYYKSYNK